MNISTIPYFPLLVLIFSGALSSCGFWKNDDMPLSDTQASTASEELNPTAPLPAKRPTKPVSRTWEFAVNPVMTSGTIDLSMDPKGAILGARTARNSAPLKGKIIVKVTTNPSTGSRHISIQDVRLTNAEAYHMGFAWGALVGSIDVDIPTGVLCIIPNSMKRQCSLKTNNSFTLPQCYFTVLGHSHTRGHGLVLTRAVGNKKMDLTMKKTEQVSLRGTLSEANGTATLHIPRAVLRDHFDLDGTRLDLVFTANITATAKIR